MASAVINSTIDRSKHCVLVVDDNPTTRYATERVIRAAGFQTAEAATGREAIDLSAERISAVVLDVHLPDINGFDVCRSIRSADSTATLPVIHLSATFIRNEDKVAGLDAGADAYLIHPVEPPVLVATLQALIRARMAEDRLRDSEARFRAIYNQAPTGMALIDGEGRFADVNPALMRMLDRTQSSLMGQPVASFAPADWVNFVYGKTAHSLTDENVWHGEFPLLRPDGGEVRLEWTMSSAIEPGLRIGIALDVSERFELEQRRLDVLEREQAARLAAERHSRTKDDFVAVLSHELRNPLNAIAGWVHLLNTRPRTPDLLEKGLVSIDRSVKAQALLISDILDVSRISSGKLRLHREWIEPGALVSASIDSLSSSAAARRLKLQFMPEGMQEPAWLDPTRFQQIVWNLLSNAIKFSGEAGVIRIRLWREADRLHLSIQDEGRGFSEEFRDHLFDRFAQNDAPDNRHHGGLGLGLSIVRNLAELHGGQATAYSPGEGKGAVFEVHLRVMPPGDEEVRAPGEDEENVRLEDRQLQGLEVLVVEDNVDASEILRVVLSDAGAKTRVAGDYVTALQLAEQAWPHVLVSDIGLPGRDGYDLIRQLRHLGQSKAQPRFFAVAMTAFSRPQDQSKAFEAGFDAHLTKPLQPHALINLIAERPAQDLTT